MTPKLKKTKGKKAGVRRGKIGRLLAPASLEEELTGLAVEDAGPESRWSRPRKRRISLRVDCEVVEWFQSKGPGYQTRINRILRRVMAEGKKKTGEK